MKKEIKYILFNMLFILSGCNNFVVNSSTTSLVNNSSSIVNSSNVSSSTISNLASTSSNISTSSLTSSTIDTENNNDFLSLNGKNILKTQNNITKTYDSLINNNETIKSRKHIKKAPSLDNLNGEFILEGYQLDAMVKMYSEPFSYAFAILEGLIVSGNGSIDFNGQTFYFSYNNDPIRINIFEDNQNLVLIRYGNYRMMINSSEFNPYVCSFSLSNNAIWMNYNTKEASLTYWKSDKSWDLEIDDLINNLDLYNQNGISGEPLKYFKRVFESENNELDNWKNDGSNIVNEYLYPYNYLTPSNLQELYYSRYSRVLGAIDDLTIENDKLISINSVVGESFLNIPDSVKEIGKLNDLDEYRKVYALHIPSSVTKIEENAFEGVGAELLFIDTLENETDENFLEQLLNSALDIRVLFKDQWSISHDIYIPEEYHFSLLEKNTNNIEIKDDIKDFQKIYEFKGALNKRDYHKCLNWLNENIDRVLLEMETKEDIFNLKVKYFDEVINLIDNEKCEYYFYCLDENNNEIKVEDVDGRKFVEDDLHIKVNHKEWRE